MKTYLKPEMEIVECKITQVIAISNIGYGDGVTGTMYAPQMNNDWDDDAF